MAEPMIPNERARANNAREHLNDAQEAQLSANSATDVLLLLARVHLDEFTAGRFAPAVQWVAEQLDAEMAKLNEALERLEDELKPEPK